MHQPKYLFVQLVVGCTVGVKKVSFIKGVYIDVHEQTDVVDYRKLYLRKHEILSSTHTQWHCYTRALAQASTYLALASKTDKNHVIIY